MKNLLLLLMSSSEMSMYMAWITAAIIGYLILYVIIKSATNADHLLDEAKKQTALLAKMAHKAGVAEREINDIDKNLP